jgi:TPR repeat protein
METPLLLAMGGVPFSSEAQVRADPTQTSVQADALSPDAVVPTVTPLNSVLALKDGIAENVAQSHSLTESRAPAIDTPVLVARGDTLFGTGDITSARLFYERAADAGSGQAALRLGESYDPSFLEQAHLRTVRGDAAVAIKWYKRARELGASEADLLLMSIQVK